MEKYGHPTLVPEGWEELLMFACDSGSHWGPWRSREDAEQWAKACDRTGRVFRRIQEVPMIDAKTPKTAVPAGDVASLTPDAVYLVVHKESGYVASIATSQEEPAEDDHQVVRCAPKEAPGQRKWQPVETAPDGVTVLTWHSYGCIVANTEHPAFGRTGMTKLQQKVLKLWPSEITETGRVTHWMHDPCEPQAHHED